MGDKSKFADYRTNNKTNPKKSTTTKNPKTLPLALGTDHLSLSTHLHSNHHPYVKGFPKIHETFVVRPIS